MVLAIVQKKISLSTVVCSTGYVQLPVSYTDLYYAWEKFLKSLPPQDYNSSLTVKPKKQTHTETISNKHFRAIPLFYFLSSFDFIFATRIRKSGGFLFLK